MNEKLNLYVWGLISFNLNHKQEQNQNLKKSDLQKIF